jgi:tetratricopeptide (TPR) repeat protein
MAGDQDAAEEALEIAIGEDPLEFYALLEKWRTGKLPAGVIHEKFDRHAPFVGGPAPFFVGSHLYTEGAVFYDQLGLTDDAIAVLEEGASHLSARGELYPMVEYYLGYLYDKSGRQDQARETFLRAEKRSPDYVFPYCPMDIRALNAATEMNPSGARAWRYMGNALFYLRRYEDAEQAWLRSNQNDPEDASVLRSLAFVDWVLRHDLDRAVRNLEKASAADPSDARILMELDYFLDAAGETDRRAELFSEREATVRTRDELVLSYSRLLLRTGDYSKAVDLMENRHFFARESRAMSHAVYAEAHYGVGEELLEKGSYEQAAEEFTKGMQYPENLGEGALANEVFSRALYLKGLALDAMGEKNSARELFRKVGRDQVRTDTESVIYQALALRELGKKSRASQLLRETESLCREKLAGEPGNAPQWKFLLSRALEEQGSRDEARKTLEAALEEDPDVILHARIEASVHPSAVDPH